MPPQGRCIVPRCPSRVPTTKLFSLPRPDALRDLWLNYLSPLVPCLASLKKQQLICLGVCIHHFEKKYVQGNKRNFFAVPTLFTREEISSGIPTIPVPDPHAGKLLNEHSYSNTGGTRTDHNYCRGIDEITKDYFNNGPPSHADAFDYGDDFSAHSPSHRDSSTAVNDATDNEPRITLTAPLKRRSKNLTQQRMQSKLQNRTRPRPLNQIQNYINQFMRELQPEFDETCTDEEPNEKFTHELNAYNFSSSVIATNKELKPCDTMDHLMYAEKAYAAITFCLLKQQESWKVSVSDFFAWAKNQDLTFESLKNKVEQLFEESEFMRVSLKILQIVCKYRQKNIEIRKENIVNQALNPSIKESLSRIRHTSMLLFDEDDLKSTVDNAGRWHKILDQNKKKTNMKHDRGIQVNIATKKSDKSVLVKPAKIRKAGKSIQVNSLDIDGYTSGKKSKRKDAGSQTTDKDLLLGSTMLIQDNPSLQLGCETINDPPINHCQKIQYVVNIKRKPHGTKKSSKLSEADNVDDTQSGSKSINHTQKRHNSRDLNSESDTEIQQNDLPKKKRKSVNKPDPSMPVLCWDACQNLLSLGGQSNANNNQEIVHSTLERTSAKRNVRSNVGKKRRPKIPKIFARSPSTQSTGASPVQETNSVSCQFSGKPSSSPHFCDRPYLLGGCKHTYDPRCEYVPSGVQSDPSYSQKPLSKGGKRYPQSDPSDHERPVDFSNANERTIEEVRDNSLMIHEGTPVVVQNETQTTGNSLGSSPMLLLTYDNLLTRWV